MRITDYPAKADIADLQIRIAQLETMPVLTDFGKQRLLQTRLKLARLKTAFEPSQGE